jgi:hypothetical protein
MKSSIRTHLALVFFLVSAGRAYASEWNFSDEVKFYSSAPASSDKEIVGRPLVAASSENRCQKKVWERVEDRLAGVENFLILQIVPAYGCPLFIRAIYSYFTLGMKMRSAYGRRRCFVR